MWEPPTAKEEAEAKEREMEKGRGKESRQEDDRCGVRQSAHHNPSSWR